MNTIYKKLNLHYLHNEKIELKKDDVTKLEKVEKKSYNTMIAKTEIISKPVLGFIVLSL